MTLTSPIKVLWNILSSEYDPVLWFIRVLFIYFLIYPVFLFLLKKKRLYPCIIAIVFVLNIIIGPTAGYATCRYWLPVYMIGAYIGYWHKDSIFGTDGVTIRFGCIGVSIMLEIVLVIWAVYDSYGLFVCRMISPILYWIISDIFLTKRSPKWFVKQSFFYFCTQMIFSIVAQKIYLYVFGRGTASAIFSNFGIPFILLVILIIVAYAFNKLMPKLYAFLTGGRT